jgi:phosphatidylinositol alpha-1,6-mannosyltransferase
MKIKKLLFISHSFPPLVGGIENQNRDLARGLGKLIDVKIIANGKGKYFLPVFAPYAFFKALFLMKKYDACLFGSGVVAPLGFFLKIFHRNKKFFSVIHALDIIYANKKGFLPAIYKHSNIPFIKKMDKLFMVGNASIEEAVKLGFKREKCTFIPNGIYINNIREKHERSELAKLLDMNLEEKTVLLRHSRFVPHKGTSWFIKNIMPKLPENIVLVASGNRVHKNTVGDPDDFPACEKAVKENGLENRIKLLPSISWDHVKILMNTVDILISPNIKNPGSMEGFGINVVEGQACGRVTIGSNMEGIAGRKPFLLA